MPGITFAGDAPGREHRRARQSPRKYRKLMVQQLGQRVVAFLWQRGVIVAAGDIVASWCWDWGWVDRGRVEGGAGWLGAPRVCSASVSPRLSGRHGATTDEDVARNAITQPVPKAQPVVAVGDAPEPHWRFKARLAERRASRISCVTGWPSRTTSWSSRPDALAGSPAQPGRTGTVPRWRRLSTSASLRGHRLRRYPASSFPVPMDSCSPPG